MTFLELILLIEERGEKVVIGDRPLNLTTDKYSYNRVDGVWVQRDIPAPLPIDHGQYLPIVPTEPKDTK
jgi:hypothetical protein